MGDLTLPGDIPGLLRRGSPVWIKHAMGRWPAVVEKDPEEHDREGGHQMIKFGTHFVGARSVFLDLSDPTGRAHAAWWVRAHHHGDWGQVADAIGEVWTRCELAHRWSAMGVTVSDEQIDILRRIVLHVAGREVTHG